MGSRLATALALQLLGRLRENLSALGLGALGLKEKGIVNEGNVCITDGSV